MESINTLMDLVSAHLSELAKSDVVVGAPIELGAHTVVTLSAVSVGFGGGGGQGEGDMPAHTRGKHKHGGKGKGLGGGSGGGGKVRPVAVIVFSEGGVQVLPVPAKQGALDKIFERIPGLIDKITEATQSAKA
ncbi:GerW family sporulation protein [Myxococcota bacterium]|nr:GerW family sporulation protein [Myxococcota bacterium]MBU1430230.1 GerW family sporulation protein [Myxococcota bacterium]MBU1898701.1 GerW family sporulation protein [Myxococcota bacterium]